MSVQNLAETPTSMTEEGGAVNIASGLCREIKNIGIPPRPAILMAIDAEASKDEPDFRHLADLIGSDVGLSAGLIKVANSPYYGFGKQVRSVPEALLVLGLNSIMRAVAGLSLQKLFPHVPDLERFWELASRTAHVSAWLATRLGKRVGVRPDDAYTLGLFRDSGIPVLMIPFPEYPAILKQAQSDAVRTFTEVEDAMLSINHAIVGAELAEDWCLPPDIADAIRYHHAADVLGGGDLSVALATRKLMAVCQLAEHLIDQTVGLSMNQEWTKLGATCLSLLELADDDLAELLEEAGPVVCGDV